MPLRDHSQCNCHMIMKNNKTAFLFDLDGVLIDSESEYSRIWRTVNGIYPSGTPSIESVIKGMTLDRILDKYYPDPSVQDKVRKKLYEMESVMEYRMLPGADKLLQGLIDRNIPRALVTSSDNFKMKHLEEEQPGLAGKFSFVVTADLITKSKPDPEGYLLAARRLGADIANCVVFEDSLQGVKAGRASGAYVVGVVGTLLAETLAPHADRLITSLSGIDIDQLVHLLQERQ